MGTSGAVDKHRPSKDWIRFHCRKLKAEHIDWDAASDPTETYNCVGYAIGIQEWWQYRIVNDGIWMNSAHRWPRELPDNEDSIEVYVEVAKMHGFVPCDDATPEEGFDKIVLYYDGLSSDMSFRHAARVISAEVWDSKVGPHSDFRHTPDAFDDVTTWRGGRVYMKRGIGSASVSRA